MREPRLSRPDVQKLRETEAENVRLAAENQQLKQQNAYCNSEIDRLKLLLKSVAKAE